MEDEEEFFPRAAAWLTKFEAHVGLKGADGTNRGQDHIPGGPGDHLRLACLFVVLLDVLLLASELRRTEHEIAHDLNNVDSRVGVH